MLRVTLGLGLVVAAGLAAGACGSGPAEPPGPAVSVDWDLSSAHTRAQVDWPRKSWSLYSTQLEPVKSARIRLPGGKLLDVRDGLKDIILYRLAQGPRPLPGPNGEILETVEVYSKPLGVEEAYRRALALAREFDFPPDGIEAWRRRRDTGDEDLTDRTGTGPDRPLGGKGGPYPLVELLYSFDKARPWIVMLSCWWPRPGEEPDAYKRSER